MRRRLAPVLLACLLLAPLAQAAPLDALATAATAALKSGDATNAENLATQALAIGDLAPNDRAAVLLNRGLARERLGHLADALEDFTAAIDAKTLSPGDQARALFDRGITHDEQGQLLEAIADYSAALKLLPGFAQALNNRANALRRIGKVEDAKQDYSASLEAGNNQPEFSLYGLGQIAEAQGDLAAAREWYTKALAANPNYVLASQRNAQLSNAPAPVLRAPPRVVASADTPLAPHPPQEGPDAKWTAPQAQSDVVAEKAVPVAAPKKHEAEAAALPLLTVAPAAYEPPSDTPELRPAIVEKVGAPVKAAVSEGKALPHATRATAPGQIQLGAWRAEGEAAAGWNEIASRAGSLLGGLTPQIVVADIPGKGRYYRLRTSPQPGSSPATLCQQLQGQGIACIAVK